VARPHVPGGRVLAASDFSALGNAAIGAAADVARRSGRGLTVMHSLDVFPAPALGAGAPFGASWVTLPETTLRDVRKAADATLRQELQANQTTGEALVADGPAVVTIVRAAESLPADVIVLGTKGHSTLRRLLLGTVAASVIRHAHCSVLIVRRDAAPAA
jgi:nucleotide-binding universal stress UspA family protein